MSTIVQNEFERDEKVRPAVVFFFQDGQAMLWDLNEGKHLYTLDGGDIINSLCFSPNRYWLCAATGPSIKIWVSWVLNQFLEYSTVQCSLLKWQ